MRRGLAAVTAVALLAAVAPAQAAAPLSTQAHLLAARVGKLEKRVAALARGHRSAGPAGVRGPAGPAGDRGAPGGAPTGIPSRSAAVTSGTIDASADTVISLPLSDTAGHPVAVRGTIVVTNAGAVASTVTCSMRVAGVPGGVDTAKADLAPSGGRDTVTLPMAAVVDPGALASFTARVDCSGSGAAPDLQVAGAGLTAVFVDRILG